MKLISKSVVLALVSSASAGPVWTEVPPDAPKLPPGQAIPFAPVTQINGMLTGLDALGGPDVADVYAITATGSTVVKTKTPPGPLLETNFDTILVLFDVQGRGIVANDDIAPGDTSSQIFVPPGNFLLAVAAKGVQPVSAGGAIFNLYQPGTQFGQLSPSGPGGGQPVTNWNGVPIDPEPRTYMTTLSLVPTAPALSPVGVAALAIGFVFGSILVLRRGWMVG